MKNTLTKILFLGVIGIGSLSISANAASSHSFDKHDAIEKVTFKGWIDQISALFPSRTINSTTDKSKSKKASLNTDFRSQRIKLHRIAGPSGMFRRVINAPAAGGGRPHPAEKPKPSSKKGVMKLSAKVPAGMGLQSKDFEWIIRSKDKKISKRIKGKSISPLLPAGEYRVRLIVGSTIINKIVPLKPKGASKTFSIQSGRLKASVSFSGGSSVKANWSVYKLDSKGRRGEKVYKSMATKSVRQTFAPGEYEVVAAVGRVVKKKKIKIASGRTKTATIRLSGSKVRLLATKGDNKSPLMKKTTWIIKNVATDKTVLTKNRHSASITLPPGRYIASATSEGITKKKSFVVKLGKSSKVLMAMQ